MLTATDLWFEYDPGKPVVRGVSLDIPRAGIVGILGPNGSGKTTLLRLLAGTRQPRRGGVTLDGVPLSGFSRASLARRMAVVPQETHLAFDYTVAEVAMMGRYAHLGSFEIEGPSDVAIVDRALDSTGTFEFRDRLFATLSGGEKQRVIIGAALAQIAPGTGDVKERLRPEDSGYLLLDEPTASLDLAYQLEVVDLLRRLHDERGVSIVISTHDLSLAATLCERVVMVRNGQVVAAGSADETLTPDHVRDVYGVDVDVLRDASGRRVLVPTGRSAKNRT